jgi:hypothetical protein
MHDRYFYPADVFSILLAFYNPVFWLTPILFQVTSTASISVFLFNTSTQIVKLAGVVNSLLIAYSLRVQWKNDQTKAGPVTNSILSWSIAILIPIALLGLSSRVIFTPLFCRLEYNLQELLNQPMSLSKYDLILRSSSIAEYLTTDQETGFLNQLKLTSGQRMFKKEELPLFRNAKTEVRKMLFYWLASLLCLYVTSLLLWAKNWLSTLQNGVKKGGLLTMGLVPLFMFILWFWISKSQSPYLIQVFPGRIWKNAVLFITVFNILAGLALVTLIKPTSVQRRDET